MLSGRLSRRLSAVGAAAALSVGLLSVPMTSSAQPEAVVTGAVVVQDDGRELVTRLATATTNTYEEPDGTMTLEAFTTPINYEEPDGEWRSIDNELVEAPGTAYEVENAANSFTAQIPADGSSTPVKFAVEDEWVTMRMHGLDAAPQVEGATATFEQVADADQVTYEVQETGLKESIVLDAPPANGEPLSYRYTLSASAGLTPVSQPAALALTVGPPANRPSNALPRGYREL